jgi:hypothetical protein
MKPPQILLDLKLQFKLLFALQGPETVYKTLNLMSAEDYAHFLFMIRFILLQRQRTPLSKKTKLLLIDIQSHSKNIVLRKNKTNLTGGIIRKKKSVCTT